MNDLLLRKLGLALALLVPSTGVCQENADSKAGLIATFKDRVSSVTMIAPSPNFSLDENESIHPQIQLDFKAEWVGFLNVDRAADYRIHGDAEVVIDGQPVADDPVRLSADRHPILIRFSRQAGPARLQIRWSSDFFADEPIPSAAYSHDKVPEILAAQDSIEHGRFLFAEMGCANCHSSGNWDLNSRRGPDLSAVASRVDAGWIYEWLRAPHEYRESAVMPVTLKTPQDRADVTAFLMTLGTPSENVAASTLNDTQLESAQTVFNQVGCAKCHDKENNLDSIGRKYTSVDALTSFIESPHRTDPHGRMPQVFEAGTQRHIAASLAGYLHQTKRVHGEYEKPPAGSASRGRQLFASNGCASCHAVDSVSYPPAEKLAGPDFGKPVGLPLRHAWQFEKNVDDSVASNDGQVNGRSRFSEGLQSGSSAFEFDGRNFVELTHFQRPDSMTISVWVKTTQGGSIVTWGRPGGDKRGSRELRMNIGQDGKNSLCYGEYNSDGGWRPVTVRPSDVNLIDGEWHHLAVVRDGPQIQHYVDGKPQGKPGRAQPGPGDYTDRLLIGALGLSQNPTNRFRGSIDELSIWETALSAEQIGQLAKRVDAVKMAAPPETEIEPFEVSAGCLSDTVSKRLPDYRLTDAQRGALRAFLTTVQPDSDRPYQVAPLVLHDLRIRQYRCTACHELNDMNVQAAVQVDDNGRFVRVERPPLLTGAGSKLTTEWLKKVLLERKRNRPWLNLRMPHFGDGVHDVPELITKSSGAPESDPWPVPDRKLATAGIEMIGERRGEVSCIACHNYRGINRQKDGVVPAPDLAEAGRTVRRDWFQRWMHNPSRLQPGTSMPQLFLSVSPEERDVKIDQLWSALVHQKDMPLPKGLLEKRTEGTRIVVGDEPVIFRMATKTPVGQLDRAINVGIPGGLNFTFDAVTCRLRYVWKGSFIDAGPAWNGRGGNPVQAGGESLLKLTSPHSIRIGSLTEPESVRFRGYRLEDNYPVFRFEIDGASVELTVNVEAGRVVQRFQVRGAQGDVYYVGGDDASFASSKGERDGESLRFPNGDELEIEVVLPLGR